MLSFKGDINLKNSLIERVDAHAKADRIIKGKYWEDGKGCALGCMTEANENAHGVLQDRYDIPVWLGRVIDTIFEGMPNRDAIKFPLQIVESIPVGVDLGQVKAPFLIFIMESTLDKFDHAEYPDVRKAIDKVINLYKSGETDVDKFREARSAADAAADAAAAYAAAYAADADAAYAAAYAADAAYAAAYAADADAAYAAAYAADADARSDQYNKFANKLLELLRECK